MQTEPREGTPFDDGALYDVVAGDCFNYGLDFYMGLAGATGGPVLDVAQMLADPQTAAREMVIDVPHSGLGRVRTLGAPVKFSATPAGVTRGAPLFGEHTREVLREHGYADIEIDALTAAGVIIAP